MDKDGNNIGISLQTFIYMITIHAAWIILWSREVALKNETSKLYKFFIVIEIFSLLDFFLIYEQPLFNAGFYQVEFTDIKILMYGASIILWNNTGNS